VAASFAGFLYALTIADQFVAAGTLKTILVIGADLLSRHVDPADRVGLSIFGDGAGAAVVGPAEEDGRGILSTKIHPDGTMAKLLEIPAGGSAEPVTAESLAKRRNTLRMMGADLYAISVRHLTSYSMQALKAAGLTSAELDWVVPHQANHTIV